MKPWNSMIGAVVVWVFMLCPITVIAADNTSDTEEIISGFEEDSTDSSMQDIIEGFEEPKDDVSKSVDPNIKPLDTQTPVRLSGYFDFSTSYNFTHEAPQADETDWRGFSRLRSTVRLEADLTFSETWRAFVSGSGFYDVIYRLRGRDEFTPEVLDSNEDELELRETYILGKLSEHVDIKAGRQLVVWGKSDNIRVTDVLNPLDLREPGLTDIVDMRLPVTMTRLDYYLGRLNLTGIAVHEIRFNKLPAFGSDFYPADQPVPPEDKPESGGDNTEWGLSLGGIFHGWDATLYYARLFDDMPHMTPVSDNQSPVLKHARLAMVGAATNVAVGNWLFKAEGAYFDGLEFFNAPGETFSRTDLLAGFEYTGFTNTFLSVEAVNRHINEFENVLEQSPDDAVENEFQTALRIERTFMNETVGITFLALIAGVTGEDGALERLTLRYDLTDNLEISGGIILYQTGDLARFRRVGDNDRLFLEIKYSF